MAASSIGENPLMRFAKSLTLVTLMLSAAPLAAQVAEDEPTTEVDALAAEEGSKEAKDEPAAEGEPVAPSNDAGAESALTAKLASLAAQGNAEAAYHLGMAYHLGTNGADKNPQKAFDLFKQSAEAGDPLGAYMLGSYFEGAGGAAIEADADLALKHKLAAADVGHALAQHDVAQHFYEAGDTDKALEYLQASAKQGYLPSLQALASLYSGEGKVTKDPVKQFAYVALIQGTSGEAPSKRLQEWRDKMQAALGEEQLKEAVQIVSEWKIEPTEVTKKALSGEAAAIKLAGLEVAAPKPTEAEEAPEGR